MNTLAEQLKSAGVIGEIGADDATLDTYSHDASLFEVRPEAVVSPKNVEDIKTIVRFVRENKNSNPRLSITSRSAGTCMSGGPLNTSIILDLTRHLNAIGAIEQLKPGERGEITDFSSVGTGATPREITTAGWAEVEPGMFYRDFEKETLARNLLLPTYPASREICAVGGMAANNGAGEKTLTYGKTENFVEQLHVVLADGNEYPIVALNKLALHAKLEQNDFEGELYRKVFKLIENNYELIKAAKPHVSKNSAGYYLWNVWDRETGIFDLNKLLVGSQGTLGIITKIRFRLVRPKKKSKMLIIFMRDLEKLAEITNAVLAFKPESFESYDDKTLKLALRFLPEMLKSMHATNLLKLGLSFLPEAGMVLTGGLPKLVLMAEFTGNSDAEIDPALVQAKRAADSFGVKNRIADTEDAQKYWTIRRESFNLLRHHMHGHRTAPFIDDIIVRPEFLPEFLPLLNKILAEYDLVYTIAGHVGNGNFHIIPLMDFKDPKTHEIIPKLSEEVYKLVLSYHGSITAEHNDGLIRSPFLEEMYGKKVYALFEETKKIFDPLNIFNPGKKVGSSLQYAMDHLVHTS